MLHVPPEAEPRRLEQRRQPEQQPRPLPPLGHRRPPTPVADPLPRRVRDDPGDPARAAHAGADGRRLQLLADDRARVEGGQRRRSRRSGSSIPEGTSQLVLQARDEPRDDAPAQARRLPQAGKAGRRRACPRSCIRCRPDAPADAADVRASGWSTAKSPTTARAFVNRIWQAYFGTGLVAHQRGLRHAERAAVASRTARLAGRRVHGPAAGA